MAARGRRCGLWVWLASNHFVRAGRGRAFGLRCGTCCAILRQESPTARASPPSSRGCRRDSTSTPRRSITISGGASRATAGAAGCLSRRTRCRYGRASGGGRRSARRSPSVSTTATGRTGRKRCRPTRRMRARPLRSRSPVRDTRTSPASSSTAIRTSVTSSSAPAPGKPCHGWRWARSASSSSNRSRSGFAATFALSAASRRTWRGRATTRYSSWPRIPRCAWRIRKPRRKPSSSLTRARRKAIPWAASSRWWPPACRQAWGATSIGTGSWTAGWPRAS